MSRDKLLCPRTSRDKITFQKTPENFQFCTFMPFLEKKYDCPVLSRVPSRIVLSHVLSRILSLSRCPFVLGQCRIFCPFVPKSCFVLSHWKPYIDFLLAALEALKNWPHTLFLLFKLENIVAEAICTHYSYFQNIGQIATMKKRSKIWVAKKRVQKNIIFLNNNEPDFFDLLTLLFPIHILDLFFKFQTLEKYQGHLIN